MMKPTLTSSFALLLSAAILSLSACQNTGDVALTATGDRDDTKPVVDANTIGILEKPAAPEVTPIKEGTPVTISDDSTAPKNQPSSSDEQPASNVKRVKVAFIDAEGKPTKVMLLPRVERTDEEWKKVLTPEQYRIVRSAGTERPFCGPLLDNKKEGVYFCVACNLPLFASSSKFQSGTGWPSFFQPITKENVAEKTDKSYGMIRTEINCARCDGHLGHVFDDGPRPTGMRYCLNSESLTFTETKGLKPIAEQFEKEATEQAAK
ncbi:MAG: peptide-methionine (R)-S-oxide reductase MsrB [Phycisphaeraceae bacterium]